MSLTFLYALPLQITRVLADKVRSYYHYVTGREVQTNEAEITEGLLGSLRTQVWCAS